MVDYYTHDTIVALATPPGMGAIGVVRLSGSTALEIADKVFRAGRGTPLSRADSHRLTHGHIVDAESGQIVDEVLLAVMYGPHTYTREDMVEIDCHGGLAAQRDIVRTLIAAGARPAEPGEFTRRAFLNGRIDLTQAEAVAAIVRAQTSVALRAAVRQLEGGLAQRLQRLRGRLLGVLAQLEAQIDFSDEDPGDLNRPALAEDLGKIGAELDALLATSFLGRMLDKGVRVAIVGRPNVGKSSLLNALVMRDRAIVSEVPGTTRDTVEESIEIAGLPVCLVDTAGLRVTGDRVEREGVERAHGALDSADAVLVVLDLSEKAAEEYETTEALETKGKGQADIVDPPYRLGDLGFDPERTILVGNKEDLVSSGEKVRGTDVRLAEVLRLEGIHGEESRRCVVSAKNGSGIEALKETIREMIMGPVGDAWQEPLLATERQRVLVEEAGTFVAVAKEGLALDMFEEMVAEDVRSAASSLGRITGQDLVEDLLDEVFSRFCIGK